MRRKFLSSAKGLTLVELLLSLSLIGVVSVLIVGILVSGMNSYRSVNKQISLHDEANAIMTKLSNEIFVATKVIPEDLENPVPVKAINIKQYGTNEFIPLIFTPEGEAKIGEMQINSSMVEVSDESSFTVYAAKGIVRIHLKITDSNNREFQLTEEVTYVNVQ